MTIYTQETLDSLRNMRTQFYKTPATELQALSLVDQQKHADDLNRIIQHMLNVESVMTSQGNEALKEYEVRLKEVAGNLEKMCDDESNLLLMIRSVNSGLGALDEIIELIR